MPDPRLFLCGGVSAKAVPKSISKGARIASIRIGEGNHQIHLHTSRLRQQLQTRLTPLQTDLLEIAACVYTADQMVSRGGTKSFDYGERWRRDQRFVIAVRCPDVWNRDEVKSALRELLEFLGDDQYEFRFIRAEQPTNPDGYLTDSLEPCEEPEFEDVQLFSGGLDSLGGALDEIMTGQRRVALVSHRPVRNTAARQLGLVREIGHRLPRRELKPFHVAIEINKEKYLSRDFTQRPRSFLFAAIAAIVARQLGKNRFRFFENGVTSLNLPVSAELIGARASRTTHPQTLKRFEKLFSLLFDEPFQVQNPLSLDHQSGNHRPDPDLRAFRSVPPDIELRPCPDADEGTPALRSLFAMCRPPPERTRGRTVA